MKTLFLVAVALSLHSAISCAASPQSDPQRHVRSTIPELRNASKELQASLISLRRMAFGQYKQRRSDEAEEDDQIADLIASAGEGVSDGASRYFILATLYAQMRDSRDAMVLYRALSDEDDLSQEAKRDFEQAYSDYVASLHSPALVSEAQRVRNAVSQMSKAISHARP